MSEYPIDSTARVFIDSDDNECTLRQLVNREPEWAITRIIHLEKRKESQALYIKRLEVLVVDMAETAYDEARLEGCDTWADFKRYKVDKALKEATHG